MEVILKQKNDFLHFEATNPEGQSLQIDKDSAGMSPMEVLLAAVAGCSSFDVVTILQKQRQTIKDVEVKATGERPTEGDVKPYKSIHLHFSLWGENLDEAKVSRAVSLSVEKYCSVATSLDPTIAVTHDFEVKS